MKTRITLYADDGMMLTDGEHFGKIVHLAVDADPTAYYEIKLEEYEKILAEQIAEEFVK